MHRESFVTVTPCTIVVSGENKTELYRKCTQNTKNSSACSTFVLLSVAE